MRTIALLLALLPAIARADDWSAADKALLGTALATTAIDWAQTRTIAKNPHIWHEAGNKFFLGSHPSVGRVNTYFAAYAITTVGMAYVLASDYRKLYLGGITLYETYLVVNNHRIGIRASF